MADNQVSVEITVEEKQALKALTMLTKNIESAEKQAVSSFKKMDIAVGVFAGNIATSAAMALKDFAIRGLRAATDEFVDFDLAVREINTLLPKTEKLTEKLKNQLIDVSAEFGTSQAEQAKAYYQIISSGAAEGAQAMDLLKTANTLAVGGLADVRSSIDILTDILNIYGAENITASEAADTLFTTVRLGKTTIPELTSSLGQVLPAAKQLGLSLDDVGSALAAMTVQGLTTSERVTQLNALFTAVFKKSGEGASKFGKELSEAFSVTALRTKGLAKFLEDLKIASGGSEERLVQLLGRAEAARAVFALTGDGAEILGQKIEGMGTKAGSAKEALSEIEQSLSKQFSIAVQNATNSITRFLSPLGEMARKSLVAFNSMFKDTETVDNKIKELKSTIEVLNERLSKSDGFYRAFMGRGREEDQKALDDAIAKLKELEELTKSRSSSGAGGDSEPVSEDPRVKKEIAVYDEIDAIRAERALAEEENRLREKENALSRNEEDLRQLHDLELQKLEIRKQFALEKASFIVDDAKRERELNKINAKFEVGAEKLKGKQLMALRKQQQMQERANFNARNQTTANFIQAGLALVKDGSSAQKALMTADAIRNTYVAANQALSAPPGPPWSFALAASTVAMGLANVAKINSFQTGGVIGGFNGASIGADNTVANVRNGEMVLTGSQQRTLFEDISSGNTGNSEMMSMLKMAIESPVVIEIDGREIARANRTAIQEGFGVA